MTAPKIWKVSIVGDQGVGKTSIVKRFVFDTFNGESVPTEETKVYKRKMDGILLMIWDVSVYDNHVDRILSGSKAVIIVGDITRYGTYETMADIARYLNGSKNSKIFVGNKNDLKYRAEFWKDELKTLSERHNSTYFFTSAKTGEGINEIFQFLTRNLR